MTLDLAHVIPDDVHEEGIGKYHHQEKIAEMHCPAWDPLFIQGHRRSGQSIKYTETFIPGFRSSSSFLSEVKSMRTGILWMILTKFPVALSGGTIENFAPDAGARERIIPSKD